MLVSEYYNLELTQPELDFLDVDVDIDLKVYIDPRALRLLPTEWGDECVSLIQNFFSTVLSLINDGDNNKARRLLVQLREPNETHLGVSVDKSRGHALGNVLAFNVWKSLRKSRAVQTGLLEDLEDTILLIPGVSNDIISDITTNIIRGPLIKYTQEVCEYYNIPMTPGQDSGPIWDSINKGWHQEYVSLPRANNKKLLLVPKAIVRKRMDYSPEEYYNHYILSYLVEQELSSPNSELVQLLKKGGRKVTKKSVKNKYGQGKEMIDRETVNNPEILDTYREAKRERPQQPLRHSDIADIEGNSVPDYDALLEKVMHIPAGPTYASKYHRAVEALLTALFYPSLVMPVREYNINEGRKRLDIRYTNAADEGFFKWLRQHYVSAYVPVECKNYTRPIGNPEFDQLSGRFSDHWGRFGLLTYRSYDNKTHTLSTCRDTCHHGRGIILPLDDDDLKALVAEKHNNPDSVEFKRLRDIFDKVVA